MSNLNSILYLEDNKLSRDDRLQIIETTLFILPLRRLNEQFSKNDQ